jgi:hypothetical protein
MATPIDFTMLGGRLTMMWKPEPTGVFQSEEATKIVMQMEKVLREQIAQEIEQATESIQDKCKCGEPFLILMDGQGTVFADIARGQK